jgi:CRP-like cAMP-binding protein
LAHQDPAQPIKNRILSLLPPADYSRLCGQLRPVTLELRQVLYRFSDPVDLVYFPNRGLASAMTVMENGNAIEVATIGNEGVVGLSGAFGAPMSPNEVIIQLAGDGLCIDAEFLKQEPIASPLRKILLDYWAAYMTQISYSVACNGLHQLHQRCCRWLLMCHDRMESDSIPLTHEFLAIMLGVRRASVTEVLQPLQERKLIANSRGTINILNRRGLEQESCECYRHVKVVFDRLLQ